MRAGGRRELDAALAQRAHLLDRAAGEHRLGARRDARAQLRPRPRDDGDDAPAGACRLPTAGPAPAPGSRPARRARARARRAGGRSRAGARPRAGRGSASSASAAGPAALVVERLPARALGGGHRGRQARGRPARRAGRGPCRRRRAASRRARRSRRWPRARAACARRRSSPSSAADSRPGGAGPARDSAALGWFGERLDAARRPASRPTLTISPAARPASARASADLPDAVAPKIATTIGSDGERDALAHAAQRLRGRGLDAHAHELARLGDPSAAPSCSCACGRA